MSAHRIARRNIVAATTTTTATLAVVLATTVSLLGPAGATAAGGHVKFNVQPHSQTTSVAPTAHVFSTTR